MVINRTAARMAALTAGAATVGVLSIGTAFAAGSTAPGAGATNPLGSVVTGTAGVVTGTVNTVVSGVATGTQSLPKPVQKVAKTAQTTVKTASGTIDSTLSTLTGSTSQPSTPPAGSTTTTSNPTTSTPVTTHHRAKTSAPVITRAAHRRAVTATAVNHLNYVAPLVTTSVEPASYNVSPVVTDGPALQTPNNPSNEGLLFGLAHPSALLPQAEHDSKFQIELLMLATVMAGAVGAAHVSVARRRLANGNFSWAVATPLAPATAR